MDEVLIALWQLTFSSKVLNCANAKGVPKYEEIVQQSIVGVFNQAQTETQRQ